MSNSTTEATRKRVKLRRLEETDEKEELRIKNWDQGEIAYPLDWKYESSKSLDLEFLRMAENRSYLNH